MYFFPLASNTPPFPLLCTLYNSLMTLSGELVGWALCAACEKRLPKITSRGINEKLIVLIVSVPQKFAILRKHITTTTYYTADLRHQYEFGGIIRSEYLHANIADDIHHCQCQSYFSSLTGSELAHVDPRTRWTISMMPNLSRSFETKFQEPRSRE